jgi:hypothetical protein
VVTQDWYLAGLGRDHRCLYCDAEFNNWDLDYPDERRPGHRGPVTRRDDRHE